MLKSDLDDEDVAEAYSTLKIAIQNKRRREKQKGIILSAKGHLRTAINYLELTDGSLTIQDLIKSMEIKHD